MNLKTTVGSHRRPPGKRRPKVLSLLMLLLLTLPAVVQAQFSYTDNGDGTITITGYTGPGGDVTIPDSIAGWPVTTIGNHALYGRANVTSVIIPYSVYDIGDAAFAYCLSLTSVTIPDSVTSIGVAAFTGCTSLSAIAVDALNSKPQPHQRRILLQRSHLDELPRPQLPHPLTVNVSMQINRSKRRKLMPGAKISVLSVSSPPL